MELIAADKNTVTIKMNRQDEFATIVAIFMAVHQEYDQLDPEIHNVSEADVVRIEHALEDILDRLPARK